MTVSSDKRPKLALVLLGLAAAVAGCASSPPRSAPAMPTPMAPPANDALVADAPRPDHNAMTNRPPLTVEAAVRRAVETSSELAVLRAALNVARERVRAASDGRDPELRLAYGDQSADATRTESSYKTGLALPDGAAEDAVRAAATDASRAMRDTSDTSQSYNLALRFFPANPWERRARVSGSKAVYHALEAELQHAESSVTISVRRLYTELYYLRREAALRDAQLVVMKELLATVRARTEEGTSTVRDVMTASRRYLAAMSDRERLNTTIQDALAALSERVGQPLDMSAVTLTDLFANPACATAAGASAPELARLAIAHRADLAALAWRTRALEAGVREADVARRPWFGFVQAGYAGSTEDSHGRAVTPGTTYTSGRANYDYDFTDESGDSGEWRIEAAISLPILSWMNHEPDVRRAECELARIAEREARKRLTVNLAHQSDALRRAVARRAAYGAETTPLVKQIEAAIADYENAPAIMAPDDIARLRNELLEARLTELSTDRVCATAMVELEAVLGIPIDALDAAERDTLIPPAGDR